MPLNDKNIANVDAHLEQLAHPLTDTILALRQLILGSDNSISEHIKWNSPAYYFNGILPEFDPKTYLRDLLVLNLKKPNNILIIFPNGALIDKEIGSFDAEHNDGRRMINVANATELDNKSALIRQSLVSLIKNIKIK